LPRSAKKKQKRRSLDAVFLFSKFSATFFAAFAHTKNVLKARKTLRRKEKAVANGNQKHHTKNTKKRDGRFKSKHIDHSQPDESARAVYGLKQIDTHRHGA